MLNCALQGPVDKFEICVFFRSKSKGSTNGNASPEKNGDGEENAYGDDWSQLERFKQGHFFSTFTCKLFTRFPSVFNLVIILRSTHIYQVYKTFCRNNKLFQSRITNVRERRNTGGWSIPFFQSEIQIWGCRCPFRQTLTTEPTGRMQTSQSSVRLVLVTIPTLGWPRRNMVRSKQEDTVKYNQMYLNVHFLYIHFQERNVRSAHVPSPSSGGAQEPRWGSRRLRWNSCLLWTFNNFHGLILHRLPYPLIHFLTLDYMGLIVTNCIQVCQTCAKLKNVCQTCMLDLEYGLPIQVVVKLIMRSCW